MDTTYVAGELADDLMRALAQVTTRTHADGSVSLEARLEPKVAAPLWRALTRVEAELLVEDADQVRADNGEDLRTAARRRADALLELTRRLAEALPPR